MNWKEYIKQNQLLVMGVTIVVLVNLIGGIIYLNSKPKYNNENIAIPTLSTQPTPEATAGATETPEPTATPWPSDTPTPKPTIKPTPTMTVEPTAVPTAVPTTAPTQVPTTDPTPDPSPTIDEATITPTDITPSP